MDKPRANFWGNLVLDSVWLLHGSLHCLLQILSDPYIEPTKTLILIRDLLLIYSRSVF